jgi:uncharacterized protein YeaO (DUF488 family)
MIKTKSVYQPSQKEDGKRILVSRLHPRGVKKTKYDAWIKELSPSIDLIYEYKKDKITWRKFFLKYKKELENNPESITILKSIRKESKTRNVTLLCFEPEGSPCHRHVLREIIKKQKLLKENFVPNFFDN